MKFTDIHTSLNKDVDLKRFHPNVKIEVESFNYSQKKIDVVDNLQQTIDSSGNKKILVKPLSNKQKPFDSVFQEKKPLITISPKIKKRFKLGYIKSKFFYIKDQFQSLFSGSKLFKYSSIIAFIFILVLFDKFLVEYNTNSGYKKLLSIGNSSNKENTIKTIESAHLNFILAQTLFFPFRLIPNQKVENAQYIIKGGEKITKLVLNNTDTINNISQLINKKGIENVMFSQLLLNNKQLFKNLEKNIETIENIYSKIQFNSSQIEENLKLNVLKEKLKKIKFYIYTLNNNFDDVLDILGHTKRKKYLIVFQNNDEIRPTGGFMGSMGILETFRGQIKKFEKNDVYFYEFKIKKEKFKKIIAPEGINKISKHLGLRDANYYINNKDSADKIRFFMKKSGYPIDGIIYINQNTFLDILNLIGEFDSKILSEKVNSKNFSTIMSLLVEAKVSQKSTISSPKDILFKFINEFQAVLEKKNVSKNQLIQILLKDIRNRDITFYSFNNTHRDLLESLSIYNPINYGENLDFSYPVFTSISGNKSDRYISHSYSKTINKGEDCSFNTSLTIKLKHNFGKTEENYIKNLANKYNIVLKNKEKDLLFIQGKGLNKQYVRVIIPKNAQVKNTNVSIIDYKDRGKSIGFYMNTPLGREGNFTINYSLPNKECNTYNYKFYKQPGIKQYDISIDKFGEKIELLNNKKDVYIN